MLRLPDRWVWDMWFADTGSEFHMFYLQASRDLVEPDLRHANASVGHAVSSDLRQWETLSDALLPGPAGAWDDHAIWTGSIALDAGTWRMLYTGTTLEGDAVVQRIGLATSDDLSSWERQPRPVIELDERWYEMVGVDGWRDPWLLPDPDGHGWHALITASARQGPADARGVIGHAVSTDLLEWELQQPLSEPGEFGHLEVPQVELVDGVPVLLFSVATTRISAARAARHPGEHTATYAATGDTLLGPWDIAGARQLGVPDLYSARLIQDRAGEWQVIGFFDGAERGGFRGEISDPIPWRELPVSAVREPAGG